MDQDEKIKKINMEKRGKKKKIKEKIHQRLADDLMTEKSKARSIQKYKWQIKEYIKKR